MKTPLKNMKNRSCLWGAVPICLAVTWSFTSSMIAAEATRSEEPSTAAPQLLDQNTNVTSAVLVASNSVPAATVSEETSKSQETMVESEPANSPTPESAHSSGGSPDGLRLNFRGVPLDMVLNYLSEAAGFIIVLETQPRGRVDVWSNQPLTREEAVTLLNSVLQRNGLAAIRKGRTLTIINRDEAKTRSVPVKTGGDPESIPDDDEIVTQIIPIRYVEATQLLKDLQPLVSVTTPMTANESGNSIVITDTQSTIRRVAEIIKAIDSSAEDVTEVRVFSLTNADPVEICDLLTSLFPDESRSGGQTQGGGFRSFFRGGPPMMGGASTSSGTQSQRVRRRARVLAVPDQRTSSIVVTAARELMGQIEEVVVELDENPARRQSVKVFQLQNADPQETMEVLQDIFQKSGTQTSRNNNRNQGSVLQNRSEQQQNQQTTTGLNRSGNTRRTTSR